MDVAPSPTTATSVPLASPATSPSPLSQPNSRFRQDASVLAACEPKALRYRFLHIPSRLTHSADDGACGSPCLAMGGSRLGGLPMIAVIPHARMTLLRPPTTSPPGDPHPG